VHPTLTVLGTSNYNCSVILLLFVIVAVNEVSVWDVAVVLAVNRVHECDAAQCVHAGDEAPS